MGEKEGYELGVMEHPPGIACGCAICRSILRQGTWVVGLKIGTHRYVIGCNPPVRCCDTEKQVIEVFATEAEAQVLADAVREHLDHEGTTENLVLYEFHRVVSAASH